MVSAGFEHANLGTKSQHATPRPPKLLLYQGKSGNAHASQYYLIRTLSVLFLPRIVQSFLCVRPFVFGTSPTSDVSSKAIMLSILSVDTELSRKTGEYGLNCSHTLLADRSARRFIFVCTVLNILALDCRRHSKDK